MPCIIAEEQVIFHAAGRSFGEIRKAARYAAAPQARVTLSPNCMAITMARTDPSTLEPAFMAQAHSIALSLASAVWELASARKPLGNGMPMANPNGASKVALTASLATKGMPT